MTRKVFAVLVTCVSLTIPTVAWAADPDPRPFKADQPGLLSSWLESNFSQMTYLCLGGQKIKLKKSISEKTVSSIPAIIAQNLKLSESNPPRYKSFSDATLTRLFGYIYRESDSESGGVVADPSRYLPDNYGNTDDQLAEDGLGLVTYNVNCTSSLNSAVSFNAGYQLAPATLEAAAKATLSRKFDQMVSLTSGTFVSPVYRDWQVATPARDLGDRFRAAALFWQWYRANGNIEGKLLTSIIGWSLYRDAGSNSDDSIEARASAGMALPVLTASTKINSANGANTRIRRRDFYFVMQDRGSALQSTFEPLPKIEEVVAAMKSSVQVRFAPVGDNVMRKDVEKNFIADVLDLPTGLCAPTYAPSQPATGKVAFRNAVLDSSTGICRFTLAYTPTTTAAGTQNFTVDLTWSESGMKPGVLPFAIPVPVAFVISDRPKSQLESNIPVQPSPSTISIMPPHTLLAWKTNVRVFDEGLLKSSSNIRIPLYLAGCGSTARVGDFRFDGVLLPRATSDAASVLLQINVTADYAALVSSQWPAQLCEVQGNIEYEIGGEWIPRPLPNKIQLVVPVEAPPQPGALIQEVTRTGQ
jgi:hypothetical protein